MRRVVLQLWVVGHGVEVVELEMAPPTVRRSTMTLTEWGRRTLVIYDPRSAARTDSASKSFRLIHLVNASAEYVGGCPEN